MSISAGLATRDIVGEVRAAIAELAVTHGNAESGREAAALAAAAAGRAAFWTSARYHNAAACLFAIAANELGLDLALAFHVDAAHPMKTRAALLATLVPLNASARAVLAAAVERRRITVSVFAR